MKIADSQVSMSGKSEFQQTHQITELQRMITLVPRTDSGRDTLQISEEARNALKQAPEQEPIRLKEFQLEFLIEPNRKVMLQVFDKTLEVLSQGRIRLIFTQRQLPVTIIKTERHEIYRESEKMSFEAQGKIKTADGKEIDFSAELTMSREFAAEHFSTLTEKIQFKDPLVVNFDGPAAALTDTKFSFDLDNDGELDQLSFLKSGSGFLALDQNQDGIINNGSELFGAMSGNGFLDLAQYDLDHNGWIDENDSIFEKLRIWCKDQDGNDVLFGLGQKGIGAVFLGNIDTQYSFKNEANQTQGELRRTGIFLREDGTAGTIQQVDLVV